MPRTRGEVVSGWAAGGAPTDLRAIVTADARHADANEAYRRALGYTAEEIDGLPFAAILLEPPEATLEIWARFTRGEVELPAGRLRLIRRKDGRAVEVITGAPERLEEPGLWVVSMELVRLPTTPQTATRVATILEDWRAAERQLASLAPDSPFRTQLQALVADLRERYREASGRS